MLGPGAGWAEERALFERLFKAGVYAFPGRELLAEEPGWFRLSFALPPDTLAEGPPAPLSTPARSQHWAQAFAALMPF